MAGKITYIKALEKELCGYWPGKGIVSEQYVLLGMEPLSPRNAIAPLKAHQLTHPSRMEGVQKGFLSGSYAAVAPVCRNCPSPCVTLRVNTQEFRLSTSQKKMMNDGRYVYSFSPTAILNPAELYGVFRAYTRERHAEKESGMSDWNRKRFAEWIDFMPFMITARNRSGRLAGYAAVNAQNNFAVLDYLAYHPDFSKHSIGKRLWLQMMTDAQTGDVEHVYVGAWSKDSPKLDYKKNHSGLETIVDGKWVPFVPEIHGRSGTDFRGMLKREGFDIG